MWAAGKSGTHGKMGKENTATYEPAMREALLLAMTAQTAGDVPVGAVVLNSQLQVIGRGYNKREAGGDPFSHAEVVALTDAAATIGGWRLDDCTLVVTLEPCTMCAGAAVQSRVGRIVFGAFDAKAGAVGSLWDVVRDRRLPHRAEVVPGVLEDECRMILSSFFAAQRASGD
jgi:tRNA(adenine34) deaminase